MIKAVIFDLDGTLLNRHRSLLQFIGDQFERLIKPVKNKDKENYINRFIELDNRGYAWKDEVYQKLIEQFELPLDWEDLLNDYKIGFCKHAVSYPNTYELLEKLKQQGLKLGMITNGFSEFQSSNIQALGLQKYMDVILISETERIKKPDPAIFLRAASMMGVLPKECAYIGDHPINDVTASRNVGMKGIWKKDTHYTDEFESDAIVEDLIEVITIIENWNIEFNSKRQ